MMTQANILGFLRNLELVKRNVSSTNGFLANHLSQVACVSGIHDVALTKFHERLYLVKNFSTNKKVWGFKFATDLTRKLAMTQKACQLADNMIKTGVGKGANATLQIGSEFSLEGSKLCRHLPKFSYHDNNIMAYLKSNHRIKMTKSLESRVKTVINYESRIYKHLTGIFTMTDFLRNSFIEDFGVPEDKVHCIGFGCNTSSNKYIEKDYSKDIILFIAKDSFEEKGGMLVIEAFKKIKEKRKNAKLFLVGQNINIDYNGITVIGFLDKRNKTDYERLVKLYRKATLFIMPSYVEAVGNVFLEAMSFQLPCIGVQLSAMPEIIESNKCGLVTPPGSVTALTNAAISILEDKKYQKKLGDNGYKAVSEHYNWNNVSLKALAIIESCI